MSPKRSRRTFMAGALSLSLLAALLVVPGVALSATPNWSGSLRTLPPVVEQGAAAGYEATIINSGPSAISQLFVTAVFSQPYVATTAPNTGPAPKYVLLSKDGAVLANACGEDPTGDGAGPLSCNVGSLAANGTVTLIVAYSTTANSTANAGVTVRWTSVGTAGDGDNSRGDVLTQSFDSDPLSATPPPTDVTDHPNDFGGGFSLTPGATADNNPISAVNLVSTALTAPAGQKNLVLTVADQTALTGSDVPACPEEFTCVLEAYTSELHLGDGSDQYGLSKAVIEFYKTALKGVSFGKLTVIHFHDDGSYHEVTTARSCDGQSECAMFQNLSGGHGRVTIYLEQNGFVKYH